MNNCRECNDARDLAVFRARQFDDLVLIATVDGPAAMLAAMDAMPETVVREILTTAIARCQR